MSNLSDERTQQNTGASGPEEGQQSIYTPEQQELLRKVDELIKKTGGLTAASEKLGINKGIISQMRSEKYTGNVEAQFAKFASYFATKEEAAALPSAATAVMNYVPTSISKDVYSVIRNCHLQGGLAVARGSAGIGKTMACKRYVQEHPSDSILITLNPCLTTIRSILKILSVKLNVSEKTIDEMWFGVADKLHDGMVLIVDEAQHCPIRTLEALRAFSDAFAEQGQTLGIALIGNDDTINIISGNKKVEYAQIKSRTRQNRVYGTKDVRREDIELLFPDLAGCSRELEFMHLVAQSSEAVRGAVNVYNNAADNGNTTLPGLCAMAKHMGLRV